MKQRQSNMELLRIVSMFCIVLYHIFIFGLSPAQPNEWLYKALQLPFHIGVPLFVMISGYFGIHFSFKGLFRLLGMAYIYAILVETIAVYCFDYPMDNLKTGIFVIGHNRHWFLTTYLWLYLFSPIINKYISSITKIQRLYILAILALMVFYSGHLMQTDSSLTNGKNLVNFIFLYVLGNTVHTYQNKINTFNWFSLIIPYFVIVACLLIVGKFIPTYQLPLIGNVWYRFFEYDSPGIYLMVILVFMMFSKMKFQSKLVNYISGGVFSMYLLSVSFIWEFVRKTSVQIGCHFDSPYIVISLCVMLTLGFMAFSVAIDKILTPIWKYIQIMGDKLDQKLNYKNELK